MSSTIGFLSTYKKYSINGYSPSPWNNDITHYSQVINYLTIHYDGNHDRM